MMLSKEEKLEILYDLLDELRKIAEDNYDPAKKQVEALESAIRAYATKAEIQDDFHLTWKMRDLTEKEKKAIEKCIDGNTITGPFKFPNSGKTGHWYKLNEGGFEGYYCSRCHKHIYKIDYLKTTKWVGYKYCPYCGSNNLFIDESQSDIWSCVTKQCNTCVTCKHYNTEDKDIPFCDLQDKRGMECMHHDMWEHKS